MLGKPKYKHGDVVKFNCSRGEKNGTVEIVDAYGTFSDPSDVSYDILVEDENCLYKHIREDGVEKIEEN